MNGFTKKIIAALLALSAIGGGVMIAQGPSSREVAAQGAPGEMPPMPVPVLTVDKKPVQIWKEFSGRLMAVDYVEVRPQVSGIIEKIHFSDGAIVKQGDILFNIDARPYQAAVSSARADLAAAKEEADFAQKELARAEELLKTGAISKQGYDQRVNSQKVNKSGIAGAAARLKAAEVDLNNATIRAPISGRISRPEITEGNLVTAANAPLLTTIVSENGIYADFEVDEKTYLNFVRGRAGQTIESEQGIPVRLTLNEDRKEYTGTIKSFDNKINPSSGTIRARALFNNDDGALLPGMFARVKIGSPSTEAVITVPEKAVLTDQSRKFVYVAENGVAAYREIKLGETVDGARIVTEGLKAGDQVIIDNLMKLRPGAPIQAMSPQEIESMKAQMAAQGGPPGAGGPPADAASEAPMEGAPPEADREPQPIPFEENADKAAAPPADNVKPSPAPAAQE
jgi:multidrug efflux system membrane fusion protein